MGRTAILKVCFQILVTAGLALGGVLPLLAQEPFCTPHWQPKSASVLRLPGGALYFDGQQFVDCGSDGSLQTSPDGVTWTQRPALPVPQTTSATVTGGFFWNGRHVMLGQQGACQTGVGAYVSRDLTHWELFPHLALSAFYEPAGNFLFSGAVCCIGCPSNALMSMDGLNWLFGGPSGLEGVGYDDTRKLFVASFSGDQMGASTDGLNWTRRPASIGWVVKFAAGPEAIVGISNTDPTPTMVTSPDGQAWSTTYVFGHNFDPYAARLHYGGGRFLLLTARSLTFGYVPGVLSQDGIHWTEIPDFPGAVTDFAYGAGHWVAKLEDGRLYASPDGLQWTPIDDGSTIPPVYNLIRAGSPPRFVATSIGYSCCDWGSIWTSDDGSVWSQIFHTNVAVGCIAWGAGRFVVAGYEGLLLASDDGVNWVVTHDRDGRSGMPWVVYGQDRFVAASADGQVITSSDGLVWTPSAPISLDQFSHEQLSSLSFGAGHFVVGTTSGRLLTSPDGVAWHVSSGSLSSSMEVVYGDHGFIAGPFGENGYLISVDGEAWEEVPFPFPRPNDFFEFVWYVNHHYLMPSDSFSDFSWPGSRFFASEDGRHWSIVPSGFPGLPGAMVGDGSTYWGMSATPYQPSVLFQGTGCVPSISSVTPSQGPMEGGTEVAISGTALSDVNAIYFGATPAASFRVVSDSLIRAVTPMHDPYELSKFGSSYDCPVSMDSPQGHSPETPLDWFRFTGTYSFNIDSISWHAPKLTITGRGFTPESIIRIDGRPVPQVKLVIWPDGAAKAIIKGGQALKAMLPKRKYVLITVENPGQPLVTAFGPWARP